jgi:uncharacterized protein
MALADLLDTLAPRCRALLGGHPWDAAHDLAHVERVVATARRLAAAEGARREIVEPAAWLHDCVRVAKDSPERASASRLAAARATELLATWSFPEALLAEVAHAIEAHSFTAGIAPRTVEARVVQDADRLDALGAVGLARCLMLSAGLGRPLYVPEDPFCAHRSPDDSRAAVDHFFTKLLRLEETMQTASGRAEARERSRFLESYLAELRRELAGLP